VELEEEQQKGGSGIGFGRIETVGGLHLYIKKKGVARSVPTSGKFAPGPFSRILKANSGFKVKPSVIG
jgi:hypothetical protein